MLKRYYIFTIIVLSFIFPSCQAGEYLDDTNKSLKKGSNQNMVLIPEGKFVMGSDDWIERGNKKRVVILNNYYIDKYAVSNKNYNRCVKDNICEHSIYYGIKGFNEPDKPITGISFQDAQKFCKYMGKRLPTEAEWEKAARGVDGRKYPWGDDNIDCSKAVYGSGWSSECKKVYNDHPISVYDVKNISPYGVVNMVGNVWEWTTTKYEVKYYYKPKTSKVEYQTIKGGAFGSSSDYLYTYSRRWERDYQQPISVGFRCVKDIK